MKDAKKLLNNKIVFYAVAALAVVNVAGYATTRSYPCLGAFAVSALVINHFLKNKVLALLGGLFVANFFYGCGRVHESMEGLPGKLKKAADAAAAEADKAEKDANDEQKKCEDNGGEWSSELNECKAKAAKKAEIANMVGEIADEVQNMEDEPVEEGMDHLEEEEE